MLNSSYNKSIMERSFDFILLVMGLFSGFIGSYLYLKGRISPVTVIDFLFSLSSIILFAFRKKVPFKLKMIIFITFLLVFNFFSFLRGGFTGSSRIILIGLILISASFHSIRLSITVAAIGVTSLILVSIGYNIGLVEIEKTVFDRVKEGDYWYIQSFITLIMTFLVIISIKALRKVLENQVDNLNASLLIIDAHKDELEKLAYYDKLTGLPTRELFEKEINKSLEEKHKKGMLILLDIENFNTLNSLFGNDYGDRVLSSIGKGLLRKINKNVKICRTGSDEFAIWGASWGEKQANKFLDNFDTELLEELKSEGMNHHIIWHIGSAKYEGDFKSCYKNCSVAMEHSKKNHVKGINLFQSQMVKVFEREKELEYHLEKGIKSDEFLVLFQGKHNASIGELVGMEALIRWKSEELGYISPSEFIPIANNSSHFEEFSRYIFRKILKQCANVLHTLPEKVTLSINISPRFFLEDDFVSFVIDTTEEIGFPKERLILEITEDLLINDIDIISSRAEEFVEHGIKLSLDDFGTGYSSLKYLTTLSFYEIKIDKSFIDNIVTSKDAFALLSSIVAIAKITGYQVVAEGVETLEQVEAVLRAGCSVIQGFYYSKPSGINELLIPQGS